VRPHGEITELGAGVDAQHKRKGADSRARPETNLKGGRDMTLPREMIDPAEGHPELSFSNYIKNHARRTDDPEGDFIEDARGEIEAGRFPTSSKWSAVAVHVMSGSSADYYLGMEAGKRLYDHRYMPWLRSELAKHAKCSDPKEIG